MTVITVWDVLQAPPGAARDGLLRRWGRAVWGAWSPEHARVKAVVARAMAE